MLSSPSQQGNQLIDLDGRALAQCRLTRRWIAKQALTGCACVAGEPLITLEQPQRHIASRRTRLDAKHPAIIADL